MSWATIGLGMMLLGGVIITVCGAGLFFGAAINVIPGDRPLRLGCFSICGGTIIIGLAIGGLLGWF